MIIPILPIAANLPDFDTFSAAFVEEQTQTMMAQGQQDMDRICSYEQAERTYENTMLAYDRIMSDSETVCGIISLMAYVHPDEEVRNACWKSISDLSTFQHEISLNEKLFQAVNAFYTSPAYAELSGSRKKFTDDVMRDYRRNGFLLDAASRDTLKTTLDRQTELDIAFSSHINEYQDTLWVDEAGMAGLPDDYKQARKQEDGRYAVTLDAPSYTPFMKYAVSDALRKALYVKYNQRAPENNEILLQLLKERQAMATLLHYPTYADYATETTVAKRPDTILAFEADLRRKVADKARRDLQELLKMKGTGSTVIQPWEASYYTTMLLKEKYGVDAEAVKQYFESDRVIAGILDIASTLYQVEFVEDKTVKTWHPDVKTFYMMRDGKKAGLIWLDLYPRAGKYNHAACFTLVNGHETARGYQCPIAALVCNFPAPTESSPSLMLHSDVVTLFHECGHLIHSMLAEGELSAQTGINNEQDFVEVPSQFFENWAWDYEVLKRFARHHQTGEVLPEALFDKMKAARNVCSGVQTLQQIFYGMLDMTYHHNAAPEQADALTQTVRRLQEEITFYPYVEGTHMQTAFGHLTNYAAGYYGYLWSLVYAQDLFSVFEQEGLLNPQTGKRFRDTILSKGSSEEATGMIRRFLGREPSQDAFLKMLGL